MQLRPTDLPDPVVPAISRCGIGARSTTTGSPAMFLPSTIGSAAVWSSKSAEDSISDSDTISRRTLGSSMPMTLRPGTTATRAEMALIERAMSSARPMTRLALMPGAGSSSYMVTTGPGRTSTMRPFTPKSSSTDSSSRAFCSRLARSTLGPVDFGGGASRSSLGNSWVSPKSSVAWRSLAGRLLGAGAALRPRMRERGAAAVSGVTVSSSTRGAARGVGRSMMAVVVLEIVGLFARRGAAEQVRPIGAIDAHAPREERQREQCEKELRRRCRRRSQAAPARVRRAHRRRCAPIARARRRNRRGTVLRRARPRR